MTLKVRCEQCGKQSQFSERDAGMSALCVACGARFVIPNADPAPQGSPGPVAGTSPTQPAPSVALADVLDESAPAAARRAPRVVSVAPISAAPPPARGTGRTYAALYTLLGAAVTAAIVLAAVMVLTVKPTWEEGAKDDLRALVGRAEALRNERKYQDAYDTYRKIDDQVVGHEIRDPALKEELAKARAARDEVVKLLAAAPAPTQYASASTTRPAPRAGPRSGADDDNDDDDVERDWPKYAPQPVNPNLTRPPAGPSDQPKPPETRPSTAPPVAAAATAPASTRPGGVARLPRPPITVGRPAPDAKPQLTDEQIGRAIQRAVNFLIPQFKDGKLIGGDGRNDAYYTGLNALTVYSLLQSSFAVRDERLNVKGPFVKGMIDRMKAMPAEHGPVTYARGIRATALALLDRPEDKPAWKLDLNYLLNSHTEGAYTYEAPPKMPVSPGQPRRRDGRWDNSNSQYGLLGVWSLAEIGAEVNSGYWTAVEKHWATCQNAAEGGWSYGAAGPVRLSMTVAGCASLFVTHDWLDAPRIGAQVGRDPFSPALAKGLAYLEDGNNAVRVNGGYTLYGLERVGLASGFKFFGDHDWYRELAGEVIRTQDGRGGWGDQVETAYHLLFLARGRHPVIMNKLRYNGYWANRPRDVANLARFGSKELERPLNWQVVPIARDWTDWTDSPILYVASHTAVNFTDAEVDKIRSFVNAGGLLFTQADGTRPEADAWGRALAKRLFPAYEMKELSDDHELYKIHYKPSPHPPLFGVTNGARLLIVHSPVDLTQYWQMRKEKTNRSLFELGINMYLYAAGKTDLRNRLSSTYVAPPAAPAKGGTVKVARVRYPGAWDPEPMAWTRFARQFQLATDVAVDVSDVDLDRLTVDAAPFAHWTGTAAYTPNPREIAAIRKYVEAGGVLVIDPCGGGGDFYDTARAALVAAFPNAPSRTLPRDHPILAGGGPGMDDLSTPVVRSYAKHRGMAPLARLQYVNAGMGKVIYGSFDVTNALLGANTWGVVGFEPAYATGLMKNILLWSATGMRE